MDSRTAVVKNEGESGVSIVFAGGSGLKQAYAILAKIAVQKLLEGEKKCEQASTSE